MGNAIALEAVESETGAPFGMITINGPGISLGPIVRQSDLYIMETLCYYLEELIMLLINSIINFLYIDSISFNTNLWYIFSILYQILHI